MHAASKISSAACHILLKVCHSLHQGFPKCVLWWPGVCWGTGTSQPVTKTAMELQITVGDSAQWAELQHVVFVCFESPPALSILSLFGAWVSQPRSNWQFCHHQSLSGAMPYICSVGWCCRPKKIGQCCLTLLSVCRHIMHKLLLWGRHSRNMLCWTWLCWDYTNAAVIPSSISS